LTDFLKRQKEKKMFIFLNTPTDPDGKNRGRGKLKKGDAEKRNGYFWETRSSQRTRRKTIDVLHLIKLLKGTTNTKGWIVWGTGKKRIILVKKSCFIWSDLV